MPKPLKINTPEITREPETVTVAFDLDLAGGVAQFSYRIKDATVQPQKLGEALVSASLLLAMTEGRDIECEIPLSREFLANNRKFQTIYSRWFPESTPVKITAPAREIPNLEPTPPWLPAERGAAVMFSGGVDSFHTALEFQDEIQTAIYIHGFDTKLEDATYREEISKHLQAAAADLGMRLIEVECNSRDHTDPVIFWGHCHMAMINSTAHLLSENFERLYIPSSYAYDQLEPWGSHPLTDPLWATGDLHIIHHGNSFTRPSKVAAIADSKIARKHLRVCWQNIDEAYNCGECEKCIRTMINFKISGKLDEFQHLFAKELHVPDLLPHVCIEKPSHLVFLENNVAEARARNVDPDFLAQLEEIVTETTHYFAVKSVAKHSGKADGDYFASGAWRDHLLPKVRNQLFDDQLTDDPEWLAEKLINSEGRDKIFDLLWQHDRKWLEAQSQ